MVVHFDQFFCVSGSTYRFQSLYGINRKDLNNKGKYVKADDSAGNIRRQAEWTVTGVHQTFDGFLTLIRERIPLYTEVTVKPLSFCTFLAQK